MVILLQALFWALVICQHILTALTNKPSSNSECTSLLFLYSLLECVLNPTGFSLFAGINLYHKQINSHLITFSPYKRDS